MAISGRYLGAALAVLAGTSSSAAADAKPVELTYRLPKVTIGFAVSHTITQCPDAKGDGFNMEIVTAIKPVYQAGEEVSVDASGHLLVDRTVKLEFYPNGTLKSFNASSTGQGGKIVSAGIKLASLIGSSLVSGGLGILGSGPKPAVLTCHDWVKAALTAKQDAEKYLRTLEAQVAAGGLAEQLAAEIKRKRTEIEALEAQLTIKGKPVTWTPDAHNRSLDLPVVSGDLQQWFSDLPAAGLDAHLRAIGYGQMRNFRATGKTADLPEHQPIDTGTGRSLIYRVPVEMKVKLEPGGNFDFPNPPTAVENALAIRRYETAKQSAAVKIPQLGQKAEIRFDGSGLFGSRAVSAAFSETGDLTALGYTSTDGADALAGVVDAATGAARELRDAELEALKREVELRKKEQELLDLIEAAAEEAG